MVTTHSPFFVNSLRPNEVWILYRGLDGYTRARNTSEIEGIQNFMSHGALLGDLWMEGYFKIGDPLREVNIR